MKAVLCRLFGHRWRPWWRIAPRAIGAQCRIDDARQVAPVIGNRGR